MKVNYKILFLIITCYCNHVFSQNVISADKVIYKKFETPDSVSIVNHAVLILYDDNTFINYGSDKTKKESQNDIWYASGRWLGSNEIVMCRTYGEIKNHEQLLDFIKNYYKLKPKYTSLNSFSKFLKVEYLDYKFAINKLGLKDKTKDLVYFEVR